MNKTILTIGVVLGLLLAVGIGTAGAGTTFVQNFNNITSPVGTTLPWNTTELDANLAAGSATMSPLTNQYDWDVESGQPNYGKAISSNDAPTANSMLYDTAGNLPTTQGTIEWWWKPEAGFGNDVFFSNLDNSNRGFANANSRGTFQIKYQAGPNTLVFNYRDSNGGVHGPLPGYNIGVQADNWYHMAVTFSQTGLQAFFNGTGGSVDPVAWSYEGSRFSIGSYMADNTGFMGAIDSVRISDEVLYTGSSYTVPTAEFVPEPATMGLLGLGGLALLRRRSR